MQNVCKVPRKILQCYEEKSLKVTKNCHVTSKMELYDKGKKKKKKALYQKRVNRSHENKCIILPQKPLTLKSRNFTRK